VFRDAGISYLRIPATDPAASAAFYAGVFGWTIDADRPDPSFADGTGHVIGHLSAEHRVADEAGVRPYVYVADLREALRGVAEHGGAVVDPPYRKAISRSRRSGTPPGT
jgi:uncharacterized protein